MKSNRFLAGRWKSKAVLLLLTLVLIHAPIIQAAPKTVAEMPQKPDKQAVLHEVAKSWMLIGTRQYQRNFYKSAEISLQQALQYSQYLSPEEIKGIKGLQKDIADALIRRAELAKHMQTARQLIQQGEPIKARAHLNKARTSPFLNKTERKTIDDQLAVIEQQLKREQNQTQVLYDQSVKYYRTSEFARARQGFLQLAGDATLETPPGQSPEDYLVKIDIIMAQNGKGSSLLDKIRAERGLDQGQTGAIGQELRIMDQKLKTSPAPAEEPDIMEIVVIAEPPKPVEKPSPPKPKPSPKPAPKPAPKAKVLDRRTRIARSYTRAAVNEGLTKATELMKRGEFTRAQELINAARQINVDNRSYLTTEMFEQHNVQLQKLSDQITAERARWLGR